MTQETGPKIRTRSLLIAGMLALSAPVLVCAQTANELGRCSSIDDDAARLACYDKLGSRQAPPVAAKESSLEPPAEGPNAEVPVEEAYTSLTDETGAGMLGKEDVRIRAKVTACRKNSLGKYFFYFENGQVWKQKDDDRLRYKECDFSVMITKDFFGYKMQVDGAKNRTRISRVK